VIDVKHGTLCAFEQNASPAPSGLVEQTPYWTGIGQDARRDLVQLGDELAPVDLRLVEPAQQRVVVQQQLIDRMARRPTLSS
jgi:hypothetical protein